MSNIVLIDDRPELLDELVSALNATLADGEAELRTWVPTKQQSDPLAFFKSIVDNETILVITDYDLTAGGNLGLFGSTIVGWCQARAIPVGDYSRANIGNLPREPNLFELRVPNQAETGALFIANVFRGFKEIRDQVAAKADTLPKKRSPAAVLAELLGVPGMESQFMLYAVRLSTTNAALLGTITGDTDPTANEKRVLLSYIVGHILLNAVLRFAGPILSAQALCAYVGADESEADKMCALFADARYNGPFSGLDRFFWLQKIDNLLRGMIDSLPPELKTETQGELNREAIEAKVGRKLARHPCPRCKGVNGGFLVRSPKRRFASD